MRIFNFKHTAKNCPLSPALSREGARGIGALGADAGGATAIEYGLLAALISLACIIAFQTLGLNLVTVFTTISSALV